MFSLSWRALAAGCALDLLLGDPYRLPHPVRWIGRLIGFLEGILRKIFPDTPKGQLAAGGTLAVLVLGITGGGCGLILRVFTGPLEELVQTVMIYYLLAARSLQKESMKVYRALKNGDVEAARTAVSMIVGRDTKDLDEEGITKAAVETVAENISDGVIAPLFYIGLGGPVLGFVYKAINTMDSMVGYRNEKYLYFGRCAARLDDLANLIPSRLSAVFMILAAAFTGMDWKNAVKIYGRDRYHHKSPNSAHTEAVCAGALRVQLAGPAWYFGVKCEKPYIGDRLRLVEAEDIKRANCLMYGTYAAVLTVFLLLLMV